MELNLHQKTKTALWQMVHHTRGVEVSQIADAIGDSYKTVLNYGNSNMDYFPSLKKFEAMMMFTGNVEVLRVWAHLMGHALVPVGGISEKHRELSIFEAMMRQNITNGQANAKVYEAYEDGVVTPQEYEEIHNIFNQIIDLAKAADQAALKQMKKYTANLEKEKA